MREMKKIKAALLILSLLAFFSNFELQAAECPHCHAGEISSLLMNCPDCGANLHDPELKYNALQKSNLKIKIFYNGANPERLPEYGKLYINGIYRGNIPLIEREIPAKEFVHTWSNGLGRDFSAFYEKAVDNVPSGVLKIEVTMRFDRLYGFARSLKKVTFPYVSFEPGQQTEVSHRFNAASTFHLFKPEPKKPLPVVSDMKIQGAKGNVALNVPLFD